MKISVAIITRATNPHIHQVLESVKDFDEVLIVDMNSTDRTLDIARSHGCRIVPFKSAAGDTIEDARNFALDYVKYDWILMVEPDELVPPALYQYLRDFIHQGENDVLLVPRKNYLMYRFYKGSYPDYKPRFFRNSHVRWNPEKGNLPIVDGKMATLPAARTDLAIVHLSNRFEIGFVSSESAIDLRILSPSKDKVSLSTMMFAPFFTFISTYLRRGTIFFGKDGFIYACRAASDHFNSLVKVHELKRIDKFNVDHAHQGFKIPMPEEKNW